MDAAGDGIAGDPSGRVCVLRVCAGLYRHGPASVMHRCQAHLGAADSSTGTVGMKAGR